jgi:hypothetical protein
LSKSQSLRADARVGQLAHELRATQWALPSFDFHGEAALDDLQKEKITRKSLGSKLARSDTSAVQEALEVLTRTTRGKAKGQGLAKGHPIERELRLEM